MGWWTAVLVMTGCTAGMNDAAVRGVDDVEVAAGVPRGAGLTLELLTPLSRGVPATFLVTGAGADERVDLIGSGAGEGGDFCPGIIGGLCMGINPPVRRMADDTADGDGAATITWVVPEGIPDPFEVSVQAVARRGADGGESLLSNVVTAPVGAADPGLTTDVDALDFGAAPVGCATSLDITAESTGSSPLVIDAVAVPAGYALVDAPRLPAVLDPGEAVGWSVVFEPDAVGDFDGAMTITSNAGDDDIPLIGSGDDAALCDGRMTTPVRYRAEYKVADVTFLLDTTCSMAATVDALSDEFATIAMELTETIPDLTFGVASYRDYNESPFGSPGDKPFTLVQQQTTNPSLIGGALSGLDVGGGADGPEATIEALTQALTGVGYDQDCDGAYDEDTDVWPFTANPLDAFGGASDSAGDPATPGTGTLGGMGYRDGVTPVIVYATDNFIRDPDAGDPSPGGCTDAGLSDLVTAAETSRARILGIGTGFGVDYLAEMEELALAVGSAGDLDGDGDLDPAVAEWSGSSEGFRNAVVRGVTAIVAEADFGKVALGVRDDPAGVYVGADPGAFYDVEAGDRLEFMVTVDGTVTDDPAEGELLTLAVIGNDSVLLDTIDLYVIP